MKPERVEKDTDIRLVVFSDAFRHRNGVGAYYCDLLGHLQKRLGAAELVCPGKTPEGKVQGLCIGLPSDPTQKLCLPGLLKAVRTMRRVRPNIVVFASPGPYGILGLILSKFFRVRSIVGYHTQFDKLVEMYWNRLLGGFAGKVLRTTDRIFFRLSCLAVANSEQVREAAENLGARGPRLVGTPLEPRLLEAPEPHAHHAFGPVLFAGRLAAEKNIEAVLDAAKNMPETQFIIAGDGPQKDMVEKAATELDNIDYRGWLQRPELLRAFDDCEIKAMPSHLETFGTVAMEAMARQRMVLVSENCGIREWPALADGLELIGKDESLTEALRRIAAWPAEQRAKRSQIARQRAEDFNQHTVDHWIELMTEVLNRPKCRTPKNTRDGATE
ncbi:MAG: glycosyltransferase [Candidatus Sumerlaeota bacterium]